MNRPTNPPIHPHTYQKNTHPWVGNSPQIPNLQTESKYLDSFKYYRIFTDLGGLGRGIPHACVHAHAHARMHTGTCAHTCMHVKHDKHGCLHGGGHLQFSNMFIFVFRACACVHVCVHVSRDTPLCPPTHLPLPRAAGSRREPKSPKVYKS